MTTRRVLIADPAVDTRSVLRILLERYAITVYEASSALEAISILNKENIGVFICDDMLPGFGEAMLFNSVVMMDHAPWFVLLSYDPLSLGQFKYEKFRFFRRPRFREIAVEVAQLLQLSESSTTTASMWP